ncbi:MAG: hypothetical protein RLZZ387_2058, partial [Chloroflexota bacterium]|jgi:hypothetical protein
MLRTDRFLVAIVAGALLLVVVAFAVTLTRPAPSYREGAEPADIAYNYVLALQRKDYPRAYGYLSPSLKGYPDSADAFAADVQQNLWSFQPQAGTLQVEKTEALTEQAQVWLRTTSFQQGGLLDSSPSTRTSTMTLRPETGGWKIISADSYWVWCWDSEDGCS